MSVKINSEQPDTFNEAIQCQNLPYRQTASMKHNPSGIVASNGVIISNKQEIQYGFGDMYYAFDSGSDFDEETQIFGYEPLSQQLRPHLVRKKNNELIPIGKNIFRLGRDKEFADYTIDGNKYVGHSHCHIITRNGEYFVVDDNSKKHTFLDGMMIQCGSEEKIVHEQIIRLADEEFVFRLY
jgi:hypothetical protein